MPYVDVVGMSLRWMRWGRWWTGAAVLQRPTEKEAAYRKTTPCGWPEEGGADIKAKSHIQRGEHEEMPLLSPSGPAYCGPALASDECARGPAAHDGDSFKATPRCRHWLQRYFDTTIASRARDHAQAVSRQRDRNQYRHSR
jgi:hypothetical protein